MSDCLDNGKDCPERKEGGLCSFGLNSKGRIRFREVERKEIQWHFFRVAGGPERLCCEEIEKTTWVWAVDELNARPESVVNLW